MDSANEGSWTPLMYASYIGHDLVVQQLLDAGVSVSSTNGKGQSPLTLATSCGNEKTAELLIKVRDQFEPGLFSVHLYPKSAVLNKIVTQGQQLVPTPHTLQTMTLSPLHPLKSCFCPNPFPIPTTLNSYKLLN